MNSNIFQLVDYSYLMIYEVYLSIRTIVNRLKKSKLPYNNSNNYML